MWRWVRRFSRKDGDRASAHVSDYVCHLDGPETPSCQTLPCTMMPFSLPRTRARAHSHSITSHPSSLLSFQIFLLPSFFPSFFSLLPAFDIFFLRNFISLHFFSILPFYSFFFLLSSIVFLSVLLVASFTSLISRILFYWYIKICRHCDAIIFIAASFTLKFYQVVGLFSISLFFSFED